MKHTLLLTIMIGIAALRCNAQIMYCPDKDCNRCRLLRAVDYQFHAIRNDIVLPQSLDGKAVRWELESPKEEAKSYLSFDGKMLHVKSLPKGSYMEAGTLIGEIADERISFPLTLAPDDEKYGYLYCHMAGTSENTLYALGTKADRGVLFHPLIDNQPIYDAEEMAGIEGGVRDAFIYRGQDNNYLMVTTDMSNRKSRTWFNYGIDLLRSNDLIHWTSTTFDFRKGDAVFSDPQSKSWFADWTKINRVWAPQVIWDPDYNNGEGGYFIYYSMLSTNPGDDHDRIYYSYASRDFTTLTKPQLFHDRGIAIIDCHIDWNDCDRQYHVFFKKEGVAGVDRGIYEAVFDKLPNGQWRDIVHITNEGKSNVEGASAFRLINENRWKVAYINYGVNPKIYRICEANATEEQIDRGVEIGTNVNPQHGSFMTVTQAEYELLETWSALTLRVQELQKSPKYKTNKKLQQTEQALKTTFDERPIERLTILYQEQLKQLSKFK